MSVRKLIDYYYKFEQMYNEIPDAFNYGIIQPDHYNKRLKIAAETLKDIYGVTIPYEPVEYRDIIEVDHIDNLCKAGLELCDRLEKEFDPNVNYEFRYYLFHDYSLNRAIRDLTDRAKKVFSEFMPKERILFFDNFDKFPSRDVYDYWYYFTEGYVDVIDGWIILKPMGLIDLGFYTYTTSPYKMEARFYIEDLENAEFDIEFYLYSYAQHEIGFWWYHTRNKKFIEMWSVPYYNELYYTSPQDIGLKKDNVLEFIVSVTKLYVVLNGQIILQTDYRIMGELDEAAEYFFMCYEDSACNFAIDYIKLAELRGEDV